MSRVDEAYRRLGATGTGGRSRPSTPLVPLDRYPREIGSVPIDHRNAEERAEPPAERPPVAKPSSAEHRAPTVVRMAREARGERLALADARLVTGGADFAATEQYSRLAATLLDAQAEQGLRALMITSAVPREGKTLTAINLAITLSESYDRRVLLIDADLRRPSVQEVLGLPSEGGLGEVLRSGVTSLPIVSLTPNLSVLPGGRADVSPVGALASDRMNAIIQEGKAQFDWVIIDTPPVGLLPDASLVARWADAVLLVVAANLAPYKAVLEAIELLGHERVLGSVLNRSVQGGHGNDRYSSYYGASVRPTP